MFGNLTYWAVTQIRPHGYINWNGETLRVLESHPLDTKYEKTARLSPSSRRKDGFVSPMKPLWHGKGIPIT